MLSLKTALRTQKLSYSFSQKLHMKKSMSQNECVRDWKWKGQEN